MYLCESGQMRRSASGPAAAPILRWAGSKRSLVRSLLAAVPHEFDRYLEPFVGSACLFFALEPERAILGDLNSELMGFYRTFRARPRAVLERAVQWGSDPETYYRVRAITPRDLPRVDAAARFLYLNRLAFNGVYRTNRKGQFNVPLGTRGGSYPSQSVALRTARALRRAELRTGDFSEMLENVGAGDFVYLDPPYSRSAVNNWGVYGYGSFTGLDVNRLVNTLDRLDRRGAHFILSYAKRPDVQKALGHYSMADVAVATQVGGSTRSRTTRNELLVANFDSRASSAAC